MGKIMTYRSKCHLQAQNWSGTNFDEYELVQNKYLKCLGTNENIEQIYRQDRLGNNDYGQISQ